MLYLPLKLNSGFKIVFMIKTNVFQILKSKFSL